jgi:glycosyltransferase involved in cell wall biosynthesis
MSDNPLISVVIPVYNGERFIGEALDSVFAQDYQPVEVIVVDDGSTDGTASAALVYPAVHYFYQPNNGVASARNSGIALAKGEYLAFLDADDIWLPGKLKAQMEAMDIADMAFTHVRQFHSPELSEAEKSSILCPQESVPGYIPGAMLIRKETFLRVGLFDTTFRVGEFMDWYMKAREMGLNCHMLPETLLRRRLHGSNMGIRERSSRNDYLRVLRAALDRRRPQTETRSCD